MAEAEDVLLHAAERVTTVARGLWLRHHPSAGLPGVALVEVSRRLSLVIQACTGQTWPLLPVEPDAAPTWLAKRLRKLPPWAHAAHAHACTDGRSIFLPRRLSVFGDAVRDGEGAPLSWRPSADAVAGNGGPLNWSPSTDAVAGELLRLMALILAVRLARGSVRRCPLEPVARDLFWAVDGTGVEGLLAAQLPGLDAAITAARRCALASRPILNALTPRERAVEQVVRGLLAAPPGDASGAGVRAHAGSALPEDIASWARRVAARPPFHGAGPYRGVAPVVHWGRPRPDLSDLPPGSSGTLLDTGALRPPARVQPVPRRIEAREVTGHTEDARQGPFLLPFGDPQQAVEDPAGLRRPPDQGEEPALEALADELARLGRVPRTASDARVHEILEVEGLCRPGSGARWAQALAGGEGIAYPEWDYERGVYRPSYCVLRELPAPAGDARWSARVRDEHRALIRDLRRRFAVLRPARRRCTRQPDGHDLDLDAYVDDFAARYAGRTPTGRLYLADRPRRRDVAVAFLLDASGSTDAWVSGGRRVLDVEKAAALVLCEALEALGDRYAIYAFAGRGARDIRVLRVKGWPEGYGESVCARIAGLSGGTFTRLGAPIRHLTALLARQRTRRRLLFLLSDGKPNDEDGYDGAYGVEDTRQAVAEARVQGITLFCLTVDRHGSSYLPQMFGPHGYAVLWEVTQLPQRLPDLYRRLTAAR